MHLTRRGFLSALVSTATGGVVAQRLAGSPHKIAGMRRRVGIVYGEVVLSELAGNSAAERRVKCQHLADAIFDVAESELKHRGYQA